MATETLQAESACATDAPTVSRMAANPVEETPRVLLVSAAVLQTIDKQVEAVQVALCRIAALAGVLDEAVEILDRNLPQDEDSRRAHGRASSRAVYFLEMIEEIAKAAAAPLDLIEKLCWEQQNPHAANARGVKP